MVFRPRLRHRFESTQTQVLFEDFRTNSLRESLVVWNNLLQSPYVSSSSSELILVLNKIDLFRERHHLLPKYFPEYTDDPHDFDQCLTFVKGLFMDIAKAHEEKVHFVTTQLTDEHEIDAFDIERIRTNVKESRLGLRVLLFAMCLTVSVCCRIRFTRGTGEHDSSIHSWSYSVLVIEMVAANVGQETFGGKRKISPRIEKN